MIDTGLGDAAAIYTGWASSMRRMGAEISTFPNDPHPLYILGYKVPRAAAVFRDPNVWARLVNNKTLPMPDAYGNNGRVAYYIAPPNIQQAYAQKFDAESDASVSKASKNLMNDWGIPKMLQSLEDLLKGAGSAAKWGVIALLVVKGLDVVKTFKKNPRRARRGRRNRR